LKQGSAGVNDFSFPEKHHNVQEMKIAWIWNWKNSSGNPNGGCQGHHWLPHAHASGWGLRSASPGSFLFLEDIKHARSTIAWNKTQSSPSVLHLIREPPPFHCF
jgi:hypothetical protein